MEFVHPLGVPAHTLAGAVLCWFEAERWLLVLAMLPLACWLRQSPPPPFSPALQPHLDTLRKYAYGKHIAAKAEALLAAQAAAAAEPASAPEPAAPEQGGGQRRQPPAAAGVGAAEHAAAAGAAAPEL